MAKDKTQVKPANTFIDKGIVLRAEKLSGSESVRIDGTFIGDIVLDGYMQVGEPGRIEGNMKVSYALVAGVVIGNILCRATVHLAPTAQVYGDINAGKIIMDSGCIIHGNCKTRGDDNAPDIVVV